VRVLFVLSVAGCLVIISACGQRGSTAGDPDAIDLNQTVTAEHKPQDPIFIDFGNNWRQFISSTPELALPVIPSTAPSDEAWEPIVVAECVFSPDAGGLVPQVTLTWNETIVRAPDAPVEVQPPDSAPATVRVDLAVHFNGFGRNYYSSVLSTAPLERFKLPSTSALIEDSEAIMLTGPALFPKLLRFSAETIQDRDTARQLRRQTLVLRDLSQGLTYKIRLSSPANGAWHEERQYVFLTPVCPQSF
jgi:hypothetical protein